jgi:hypothetical protein
MSSTKSTIQHPLIIIIVVVIIIIIINWRYSPS